MQEPLLNVEAQQEEGTKHRRIPGRWLMMPVTVTFLCAGAAGMATMFKGTSQGHPETASMGTSAVRGSSDEQGALKVAVENISEAALKSQLNASSTNWSAPAGILRNMSQPSPVALFTYGNVPIGYPDFPSDSDPEIIVVDDPDSDGAWRDPFGSGQDDIIQDILDNGDDDVPEWEAAGSAADTDEPFDDLSDQDDPFFDEPDFGPAFADPEESPPDWSDDGLPLGDMDDGPLGELGGGLLGGGDGLPLVGEVPIEPIPLALASAANVTSAEAHAKKSTRSNKSAALQLRADKDNSSHEKELHIGNSTMNATELGNLARPVALSLSDYFDSDSDGEVEVIDSSGDEYYFDDGFVPPPEGQMVLPSLQAPPPFEEADPDDETDVPFDDLSDQDDPFFDDVGPAFSDPEESSPDWSDDGLPLGDMDDGPLGDLGDGLLGGGDGLPLVGEVPIEPIPLALASATNGNATAVAGRDVNNTMGRNTSAEARAGPQSISRFRGRA